MCQLEDITHTFYTTSILTFVNSPKHILFLKFDSILKHLIIKFDTLRGLIHKDLYIRYIDITPHVNCISLDNKSLFHFQHYR